MIFFFQQKNPEVKSNNFYDLMYIMISFLRSRYRVIYCHQIILILKSNRVSITLFCNILIFL